jgi:hypothetical protein
MKRLNWGLILALAFCVGFWLTVGALVAKAAYQDTTLNNVASKIAGHPVSVACYASGHEWVQAEDSAFPGQSFEADGFTFIGRTPAVIYLAPRVCDTLEADLHGNPAGDYWNGLAIKVLLHESSHQAGIADEAGAECNALSLLKSYAPTFGYPLTVKTTTYVRVGKTLTYKRVVKTVPNPALSRLAHRAEFWHKALPANYQGNC